MDSLCHLFAQMMPIDAEPVTEKTIQIRHLLSPDDSDPKNPKNTCENGKMLVAAGPSHSNYSQYGGGTEETLINATPNSSASKYNLIGSVAAHILRGTEKIKETVQTQIISRLSLPSLSSSTTTSASSSTTTPSTSVTSTKEKPAFNVKPPEIKNVFARSNSFNGEFCYFKTINEKHNKAIQRVPTVAKPIMAIKPTVSVPTQTRLLGPDTSKYVRLESCNAVAFQHYLAPFQNSPAPINKRNDTIAYEGNVKRLKMSEEIIVLDSSDEETETEAAKVNVAIETTKVKKVPVTPQIKSAEKTDRKRYNTRSGKS